MSIKPVEGRIAVADPVNKTGNTSGLSARGGFEALFTSALGQGSAEQAATAARLAQLQMVRGLVDFEEGGPALLGGFSSPLPLLPGLYGNSREFDPPLQASLETRALPGPVRQDAAATEPAVYSVAGIIDRAAQRYGLEPALIKAVVRAESSFDPGAVSPVGAEGLMQLMPGTARDLGVTDSFDPEQNVMGGTRYLKRLLDKYDGDLDKALAAYNWGPGNVDRKGIEVLPPETRDYLVKVRGYYREFQG